MGLLPFDLLFRVSYAIELYEALNAGVLPAIVELDKELITGVLAY